MKKNIIKYFLVAMTLGLTTYSCSEDKILFTEDNGQTALFFEETDFSLSIPEEDLTLEIPVGISTLATESRTFNVEVTSATEGTESEYSLGTVVIPANEYFGVLSIDFDFSSITGEDGLTKDLAVSIAPPEGTASYNDVASISYFREIVCNDLKLTIISDVWATETNFSLQRADGTFIVESFYPFASDSTQPQVYEVEFTLEDGDYIFTLSDDFGDGQLGTGGGVTLTGSYSLTCSIITHASGEGELDNGSFESTPFSVNP